MQKGIFIASLLLIFMLATPVFGAELRTGEEVLISTNEFINENTYLAGGQVTVSGSASSDVVVAGGRVIQNGPVLGDLTVVGGTVDVFGRVEGDVRIIGGQVTIAESVVGDVVVIGGSVSLLPSAVISGDVLIIGGAVFLDGVVNGDVRILTSEFILNGRVAGDANVRVGERFSMGEDAFIGGTISYHAPEAATLNEDQVGGEIIFTPQEIKTSTAFSAGAGLTVAFIFQFLVVALGTIIFLWIAPRFSRSVGDETIRAPLKTLGIGFVGLVMIPLVALILLISLLGMSIAGLIGLAYLLILAVAQTLSGIVMGSILSRLFRKESIVSWEWALLGVLTLQVLLLIPIIGWVLVFGVFLITFGAVLLKVYEKIKTERS